MTIIHKYLFIYLTLHKSILIDIPKVSTLYFLMQHIRGTPEF